jgi:hypothetical protein
LAFVKNIQLVFRAFKVFEVALVLAKILILIIPEVLILVLRWWRIQKKLVITQKTDAKIKCRQKPEPFADVVAVFERENKINET